MILDTALNYIFPPRCISCTDVLPINYLRWLCSTCHASLERYGNNGTNMNFALYVYNDTMRQAIHRFKYDSRPKHGIPLGGLMADYAYEILPRDVVISMVVPIPLHQSKRRERGFNQAEILARTICEQLSLNLDATALMRTRNTDRQAGLNIAERHENMEDAFAVQDDATVAGKNILLIDDIYTTGSTIQACRTALLARGAHRVLSYSLSYAPLYDTDDTHNSTSINRKNTNIHDTLAR